MPTSKSFVTIDPGITGTGIAFFQKNQIELHANIWPKNPKDDYIEKSDSIIQQLKQTFLVIREYWNVDGQYIWPCYIEQPQYMGGAKHYIGQTAADSGALVKLTWHYGRIWQLAHGLGARLGNISITKWKGQLPKDVTHNRIRALLVKGQPQINASLIEDHALDAIGIGLYLLGFTI